MLQLPGCMRCGQCGCVCGKLPYTLTVTFSGLKNRTYSQFCELDITSNFGCGAEAVATAPGGCDDGEEDTCGTSSRGPLAGVLVVEPGHDYARLGRVEPQLTITGSGSGATFTAALEPVDDTLAEQCRSYRIASVSVDGGTGYVDGATLGVTTDGEIVTPAVLTLVNERSAPTITATVSGGTGAVLAVSLASSGSPLVWGVDAVSVTAAGSGYTDGAAVTFTVAAGDTVLTAASATISVGGGEPDDCVAVSPFSVTGTGAAFSWTWLPVTGGYEIVPVIDDGGSGYTVGDFFYFEDTCNDDGPAIYVDTVDGNGAITAVSGGDVYVWPPAAGDGGISSVTVTEAGAAFGDTGTPQSVTVTDPGEFYTEDPDAPVCLADVEVSASGCGGTGAEFSVTIGDDPDDPATWGKITGITITDGGGDTNNSELEYLAWHWLCVNQQPLNGEPFVLVAQNPTKLVTLNVGSDYGSGACINIVPRGDGTVCDPPVNVAYDGQPGPIREIELTFGGSGYAVPGREQPQWTKAAHSYTFTPTFAAADPDDFDRPRWTVTAFSFAGSGSTQLEGWRLAQPSVSAPPQPPTSTRITEPVERVEEPYVAIVHTRQQPTVTASAGGDGAGAQFAVTLIERDGHPRMWSVSSVAVTNGGSDYTEGTPITFAVPARSGTFGHYTVAPATASCTIGPGGAITAVAVTYGGYYYLDNGVPQSVEVQSGGLFFRENPELEPYVANVTVVVSQVLPSNGNSAAVAVTVEDDINDADFGSIVEATLTSGGSGYTLLGGPGNCLYRATECALADVTVELELRGPGKQAEIRLRDSRDDLYTNLTVLRTDAGVGDCDELPTTASLLYGAPAGVTATIARGGVVDTPCGYAEWCGPECPCPDLASYCHSIEWGGLPPKVGGVANRNGSLAGSDDAFAEDDILFSIYCDAESKWITLVASTSRICANGTTSLVFKKIIPAIDCCADLESLIGAHTLIPVNDCECGCGTITWTVSEPPC